MAAFLKSKILAALGGGLLLGFGVAFLFLEIRSEQIRSSDDVVRDIVDVPKMSETAAEQHREKRYADLATIEAIYALPTDFARAEALHALSGRSGPADIQNLIFDANRIADEVGRNAALQILFFRFAELDAQSALAMARTDYFKGDRALEYVVWRAWGRKDLDDALFAAKTQSLTAHKNTAAQGLYAAFGFMGNETTDRIEAELGIRPDRATRSRFLYMMADRSPAEAIAYINQMPSGGEQNEYVSWLAYYLSLRDATAALRHADLFSSAFLKDRYQTLVATYAAAEAPRETIDRILASGGAGNSNRGEFYSAMKALASKDLDAVKRYFFEARSPNSKQTIGSVIATELARKDPIEALEWARANHSGEYPYLEATVLSQIARTDPQYAIAEALQSSNVNMRQQLLSNVVSQIAQKNPGEAISYLDQIDNRQLREQAAVEIASNWIRSDADAAIDWILSKDDATVARLLNNSSYRLPHTDLDAAIRVLPRLGAQQQSQMRVQIAQRLAANRSPADAQEFIRQFEGKPGYEQMQTAAIKAVSTNDPVQAQHMADQLGGGRARDAAYAAIANQRAQSDPRAAMALLPSISDEHYRGQATGYIASTWHNMDPTAATSWVANLPAGSARDDAIMMLSGHWVETSREQEAMINSIADDDKRGQAKIRRIYNIMRFDPVRAREMLQDPDISSDRREKVEKMMENELYRF